MKIDYYGTIFALAAAVSLSAFGVECEQGIAIHSTTTNGVEVRWFEEMVPMKDGVRLYTYGAIPPAGETRGIVFRRNPYVQEKPVDMLAYALSQRDVLKRGYAYVEQHVRGGQYKVMIIGLGLNILGITKLKVANFLPALLLVPLFYRLIQLLPI